MNDPKGAGYSGSMMLTAPPGVPVPFAIVIKEAWPVNQSSCTFEIKGSDPISGMAKICTYQLSDRDHQAYLDFFQKLAQDFGLSLPQNRRQTSKPTSSVPYTVVLQENLAPGMLYGYGDPAVLRVAASADEEPWYYLLVTSNDAPDAFPILRSRNLVDWTFVDYVFPQGQTPAWAATGTGHSDYWAPELHRVGAEFRVYFVARHKESGELCIGIARAAMPYGPFVPDAAPLLKGNVIDPHVYVEDDTVYLYWKEDNNEVWPRQLIALLYDNPGLINLLFIEKEAQVTASFIITLWPWLQLLEPMERFQSTQIFIEAVISKYTAFYGRLKNLISSQSKPIQEQIRTVLYYMKTPIYAQHLTPDGSGLAGERIKVLENDLEWEAHLVEGMWVTKQGASYYLFYAGNDFSTDQYGIGVAIASSPLGPYRKMEKPLLQSTETWWAPGHPSLVTAPDGKPVLFLHAYAPGKAGYKQFRVLLSVPLRFTIDAVVVQEAKASH